jgi:hypothetical protein
MIRPSRPSHWAALAIAPLLLLYLVSFARTFSPKYENLPASAWHTMDFERIRQGGVSVEEALRSLSANPNLAAASDVPARLGLAAELWVREINRNNPNAILYHEPDALANLYLVVGYWWQELEPDHRVIALDNLGNAWRAYLRDNYSKWSDEEGFAPGLVLVDAEGRYAHNLNNEVRIFRDPVF